MFIKANVADFPVEVMCELLGGSRSGDNAWASRAESTRAAAADRAPAAAIRIAHAASRGRYGSPRVHAAQRTHGRQVGRKRVARLMRGCVPVADILFASVMPPQRHGHGPRTTPGWVRQHR